MTEEQQAEAILFAKSMLASLAEPAAALSGSLYAARIAFDDGDAEQAQKWLARMSAALSRFLEISLQAQAEAVRLGVDPLKESGDQRK